MKRVPFGIAALAILATPAVSMEREEIGTIRAEFDGAEITRSTVISTQGDEVSPSAYLLVIGAGISSLAMIGVGTDNAQLGLDLTYMSETPDVATTPIDMTIFYSPKGGIARWTSEDAPTPPSIDFTTFETEGEEGRVAGTFSALLCYAETYEAGVDTENCSPMEGSFDTRFFVERAGL